MGNTGGERLLWTDEEFESMSWHDCTVYGFAILEEAFSLALDIDFITEWIRLPDQQAPSFKVVPCTLIMENIGDLRVDLHMRDTLSVQLTRLIRSDARSLASGRSDWLWRFECHSVGEITLRATGFRQYARRRPVMCAEQFLDSTTRGGISFAQCFCEPGVTVPPTPFLK